MDRRDQPLSVTFGPKAFRSLERMRVRAKLSSVDYVVADALRIYEWICNNTQSEEKVTLSSGNSEITIKFPTQQR